MQSLTQDFQRWKHDLQSVCGRMEAQRSMSQIFHGKAERHHFGDLEFAQIESNATSMSSVRTRHGDDIVYFFLVMNMAGRQHLCCNGHDPIDMQPGDLVFIDPSVPFEILPHGLSENISLHLPRALMAEYGSGRMVGGKLDNGLASTRMLSVLIRQLIMVEPDYVASKAESRALRQSVVQFLLSSLVREPAGAALDKAPDDVYRRAVRQIDAHLASPFLNTDWLVGRLQVSRRQLYRAFGAHGHAGVAQFILARRLQMSANLLRDPDQAGKSIGLLAMDVGMRDFAHFSRVFRRHFGVTPSDYRARPAV